MRYTLWIAGSYACEAPTESDAMTEARRLAEFWKDEVVVEDELLDKFVGAAKPN